MNEHGEQTVVHVFRLAAGPGDDPYENVAVVGPFAKVADAIAALRRAGWRCRKSTPELDPNEWGWELALSGLEVEFVSLVRKAPVE
jgi:hypothetical protein